MMKFKFVIEVVPWKDLFVSAWLLRTHQVQVEVMTLVIHHEGDVEGTGPRSIL